jgi:hypothetical protein
VQEDLTLARQALSQVGSDAVGMHALALQGAQLVRDVVAAEEEAVSQTTRLRQRMAEAQVREHEEHERMEMGVGGGEEEDGVTMEMQRMRALCEEERRKSAEERALREVAVVKAEGLRAALKAAEARAKDAEQRREQSEERLRESAEQLLEALAAGETIGQLTSALEAAAKEAAQLVKDKEVLVKEKDLVQQEMEAVERLMHDELARANAATRECQHRLQVMESTNMALGLENRKMRQRGEEVERVVVELRKDREMGEQAEAELRRQVQGMQAALQAVHGDNDALRASSKAMAVLPDRQTSKGCSPALPLSVPSHTSTPAHAPTCELNGSGMLPARREGAFAGSGAAGRREESAGGVLASAQLPPVWGDWETPARLRAGGGGGGGQLVHHQLIADKPELEETDRPDLGAWRKRWKTAQGVEAEGFEATAHGMPSKGGDLRLPATARKSRHALVAVQQQQQQQQQGAVSWRDGGASKGEQAGGVGWGEGDRVQDGSLLSASGGARVAGGGLELFASQLAEAVATPQRQRHAIPHQTLVG